MIIRGLLLALLLAALSVTCYQAHEATRSAMLGTTAISRRLDIVETRLDALQTRSEIDLIDEDKLRALEWSVIVLETMHDEKGEKDGTGKRH